ncbi:MAG: TM0106 family RecB-like putative nuclease [Chloroflexi bacterium]|nr:TM0106 family RecB-like putative nuclease [Chloroflexota bacterium]
MQLIDGRPVYSASDLVGHLECSYLTELERAALDGLTARPHRRDAELDVLQRRGVEHELRYLRELQALGKTVVTIGTGAGGQVPALPDQSQVERHYGTRLRNDAEATRLAMAAGADIIYQATFFDGGWVGHADFLLRVDDPERPSSLGAYHYEIADTKLAHHVKASALLQICSYIDQLEPIQGIRPRVMHVVLGGNPRHTESFRVDDFMAYYRRAKRNFEAAVGPGAPQPVFPLPLAPDPVEHCDVCRWVVECNERRRADDHLSLVAGISRRQRQDLTERGVDTLAALAELALPVDPPPQRTSRAALERVREQARIQAEGRTLGRTLHELLLPVEEDNGLAMLPPPSAGDLFLDLEGDPFAFDDGLDYLFGILEPALGGTDGEPYFHSFWSRDSVGEFSFEGERLAFEQTVDLIMNRLAADPSLHVYHYAPYEPTAFKRLMARHATREAEIDFLLRAGIFVDLYRTVRQGLRASVESYSIKKLEPLYGFNRTVDLRDAGSSIAAFEEWLQAAGSPAREEPRLALALDIPSQQEAGKEWPVPNADQLERILLYNRDDVLSTWRLRDWLEEQRAQLQSAGTVVPRPTFDDGDPSPELAENLKATAEIAERLTDSVPASPEARDPGQQPAGLLAQLLSWHRREEKSFWWLYYHLMDDLTDDERIEAKEPIGGLEFVSVVAENRSNRTYRYRFPAQEHSIDLHSTVRDPLTARSAGKVVALDEMERTIDLRRLKARESEGHPTALIPFERIPTEILRASLLQLGTWVAENGVDPPGRFRAARDLLLRTPPRHASVRAGSLEGPPSLSVRAEALAAPEPLPVRPEALEGPPLQRPGEDVLDAACRLALELNEGVLAIQGPPGSGKTFTAARMIATLLAAGRKVGITANSHKVISNLLSATCRACADLSVEIAAVQKADEGAVCDDPHVTPVSSNAAVLDDLQHGFANVAAGTAWIWARPEMEAAVDVLFIDEAGQFSLANALAVAPAARSLVLLGDPQQLDQPLQGTHPPGAEASALGHFLGAETTMSADRGLFLEHTWRMHPDICAFTSAAFYEGRLESRANLTGQRLDAPSLDGSGLRLLTITHQGNDNCSDEEAAIVAQIARDLVEGLGDWTNQLGRRRKLTWADILIVAPYNAQVAAIQQLLPSEARVGTVDKFQGQEAAISIYSMASSSADDAPRGMSFLYSRNRLNVATSRARCLTLLVCSPKLLQVRARTPEQIRLANALCQFAEYATIVSAVLSSEADR